jgi:alpha-ketoglutarate-dependent taurine dioxygenase
VKRPGARADRPIDAAFHAEEYEYRHKWRHGDWVIWDNRSVMHQDNPDYDMRERRYLYRLMLKGEAPV